MEFQKIEEVFAGLDYDDCKYGDYFESNFENYYPSGQVKNGASKGVVVCEEEDLVLKFPIIGDNDEYYWDGAEQSTDGDNYCDNEVYIYQKACEYGIEECFAETKFENVTEGGFPVYSQPLCVPLSDSMEKDKSVSATPQQIKTFEETFCSNGEYVEFPNSWGTEAWLYYGDEVFFNLLSFIEKYSYIINDLHSSNVGYCHGRPVLFDYSGFHG